MLTIEEHGDVTRVILSTAVTRAAGYTVSAYLVRGVLVDVGFPAVEREVARLLRDTRARGVMLTHHHEDHAGNVAVAAQAGLPIGAAELTLATLRALPGIEPYRRLIWGTPHALAIPVEPLCDDALRLIPTPGHSHDHHAVWDAERETLFAGDLFLGVKVRAVHPAERPRDIVRSVRAAAALHPRRLFDAHRGLVPDPAASLAAKGDWLEETIGRITALVDRGWSDRAITRETLGREDPPFYVSAGSLSRINLVRAVRAGR